ncbi:HAD-IC family P-type ATPase [Methylothermus subterraneus]
MRSHPPLTVLHDRVPGRLRLHLPALYRSPKLKRWLVENLSHRPEIRKLQINPVTGNLVIAFDPAQGKEVLLHLLEACLAHPNAPKAQAPGSSPPPAKARKLRFGWRQAPQSTTAHSSPPQAHWHTLSAEDCCSLLGTSPDGLKARAARERLTAYGPNALTTAKPRSALQIVLDQLLSPPTLLLGVSAAISLATGGIADALVIVAVVGINAVIGYATEASTERILQSLESLSPLHAEVIRDGVPITVPIAEVAVGDVLKLSPGSYVAADARLLSADNLSVDESALTGESLPVKKDAAAVYPPLTPLAERANLVYRGTVVTGGSGLAVVFATGRHTEIGLIQSLVEATESLKTPLQRQLESLGLQLVWTSGLVCLAVFALGVARGLGFLPMLKTAISLAVAAVPEGLPTVATTTLALGIYRMRTRQALIRQLNAVENLGAVQVICFDKTGTLTLNRMAVTRIQTASGILAVAGERPAEAVAPEAQKLLEIVSLCSEVTLNGEDLNGSPTEKALIRCAQWAGIEVEALRARYPQVAQQLRAEDRPFMATYHTHGARLLIAVKGSPQAVLERCAHYLHEGQAKPLTDARRRQILAANETLAGEALRVLGVAYGECAAPNDTLPDLVWLGLIGMEDALRPGMAELIARFHRAGIQTVMITGDQSATALAIARRLNLSGGKPLEVVDSSRLDKIEPEILRHLVKDVTVFARVSPAYKLQIVRALQENGKVVAMIGDGINDAPALKAADVGVAMGQRGTEVARAVADVVLEDDNLKTLYTAIEQGRTIYLNTQKALRFLLATNASELQLMLLGVLLGRGEMLSPMQLLWINLVTDVFPGLALAQEPPEADAMQAPPRDPQAPVLDARRVRRLLRESLSLTGGALAAYVFGRSRYGFGAQTEGLVFQTIVLAQLLHALSCRSETHAFWQIKPANPYLNAALGGSLLIQTGVLGIPALRKLLGLSLPGWLDLGIVGAGAVLPLIFNESLKAKESRSSRHADEPVHL